MAQNIYLTLADKRLAIKLSYFCDVSDGSYEIEELKRFIGLRVKIAAG